MRAARPSEEPLGIATDPSGRSFDLRSIACPICADNGRTPTRVVGDRGGDAHRYGLGIRSRIVRCTGCGLIFPDPFPFPVDPQELYGDPEKYFASHDSDAKVAGNRQIIHQVLERLSIPAPRVLDVGSGRGELLRAAVLEGVPAENILGLEFSDAMIDACRQSGLVVLRQTIEEHAQTDPPPYDAVILNAVLEHVYDPASMIDAVRSLTRPGSVLYLDLPMEPNLLTWVGNGLNRIRGSRAVFNLSPTFSPYHVFGFSPRTLRALLAKHEFQVDQVTIWAAPRIPAGTSLKDKALSFAGTQVNRLANLTHTAHNMCVWAVREI